MATPLSAGTLTEANALRRVQVYVPPADNADEPASLVVFHDGSGFLDPDDDFRAAAVLDELLWVFAR